MVVGKQTDGFRFQVSRAIKSAAIQQHLVEHRQIVGIREKPGVTGHATEHGSPFIGAHRRGWSGRKCFSVSGGYYPVE